MYYRWSVRSWCTLARVPRLESQVLSRLLSLLLVSSSCHRLFASCFSLFRQLDREARMQERIRTEWICFAHTGISINSFVFLPFLLYFLKGVKVDRPVIYKVFPSHVYIWIRMRLINFCIDFVVSHHSFYDYFDYG